MDVKILLNLLRSQVFNKDFYVKLLTNMQPIENQSQPMKKTSRTIKSLLMDKGKPQKELAAYLGMSESQLSQTLSRGRFNQDILLKIANFLLIDVGSLIQYQSRAGEMSKVDAEPELIQEIENLHKLLDLKDELLRAKDEIIKQLSKKPKS